MPSEECWCVCVCMHQWIFEGFPSQHALCCFSCLHVWCKHASVSQANSIILLNNELKRPVFVYECGLRGKTKVLHNLSEWQDRVFKQTFLFYASASLCLCVNAALLEVFSVFFLQVPANFENPTKQWTREKINASEIEKPTWDGAEQHIVFNAAVNVVVALWFEGWARWQNGVERLEIVCFHCSEKGNTNHWHTENTIHTQVTLIIKVGWRLFVSVSLLDRLCLLFSHRLIIKARFTLNKNVFLYFYILWCSSSNCEWKLVQLLDVNASVSVHVLLTQH